MLLIPIIFVAVTPVQICNRSILPCKLVVQKTNSQPHRTQVLWSLAACRVAAPAAWLDAFAEGLRRRLPELDGAQVTQGAWALASLGHRPEPLVAGKQWVPALFHAAGACHVLLGD